MNRSRRKSLTRSAEARALLLDKIYGGECEPGTRLPSETELADELEVSRLTIREVVTGLAEAGILVRKQGTGTFVTGFRPKRHTLDTSISYTAMIQAAGMKAGRKLVSKQVRSPDPEEMEALEIAADEPLLSIERVRTADGRPAVFSHDRIPDLLGIDSEQSDVAGSLYELLEAAGHQINSGNAKLLPVIADDRLSGLLSVETGSPLQRIDQVDYDTDGTRVMYSSEWHVPGIFELQVNRRRSALT